MNLFQYQLLVVLERGAVLGIEQFLYLIEVLQDVRFYLVYLITFILLLDNLYLVIVHTLVVDEYIVAANFVVSQVDDSTTLAATRL